MEEVSSTTSDAVLRLPYQKFAGETISELLVNEHAMMPDNHKAKVPTTMSDNHTGKYCESISKPQQNTEVPAMVTDDPAGKTISNRQVDAEVPAMVSDNDAGDAMSNCQVEVPAVMSDKPGE